MSHRIDERLGKEFGLTGRHAVVPAFQIVNDAHDLFLLLTSRLVSLEYGPHGDACKCHPSWPAINIERSGLAGRISALGNDATSAAALLEEIRRLDETVDGLVTAVDAAGLPG